MTRKKVSNDITTEEALYKLLSERLNAVDPNDLIFISDKPTQKGTFPVIVGGKRLTPQQARNLIKEAEVLKSFDLYKHITATLTQYAHDMMFKKSKSYDDMVAGKMLLYAIDLIETIVGRAAHLHVDELSTGTQTP